MRPYPSGGLRDSGYLNARVYQETPSWITAVGGGGIGNANENLSSWAPGAVTRGSTAGECGNIPKISGGHGVCHRLKPQGTARFSGQRIVVLLVKSFAYF